MHDSGDRARQKHLVLVGFMAAGNLIPDVWTLAALVPEMSAELLSRAHAVKQAPRKIVEDA